MITPAPTKKHHLQLGDFTLSQIRDCFKTDQKKGLIFKYKGHWMYYSVHSNGDAFLTVDIDEPKLQRGSIEERNGILLFHIKSSVSSITASRHIVDRNFKIRLNFNLMTNFMTIIPYDHPSL